MFAGCGGLPGPEPDGGCLKCCMRCQYFPTLFDERSYFCWSVHCDHI